MRAWGKIPERTDPFRAKATSILVQGCGWYSGELPASGVAQADWAMDASLGKIPRRTDPIRAKATFLVVQRRGWYSGELPASGVAQAEWAMDARVGNSHVHGPISSQGYYFKQGDGCELESKTAQECTVPIS